MISRILLCSLLCICSGMLFAGEDDTTSIRKKSEEPKTKVVDHATQDKSIDPVTKSDKQGRPVLPSGETGKPEYDIINEKDASNIELVADDGLGNIRATLAFVAEQRKGVEAKPDSTDKTKMLERLSQIEEQAMESAQMIEKAREAPEKLGFPQGGKLLMAAGNFCFLGGEISMLTLPKIPYIPHPRNLGPKGRICFTIGHRVDTSRGGQGLRTALILSTFVGGNLAVKPKESLEKHAGVSFFFVYSHEGTKKVKIADLEGVYWGHQVQVPLPSSLALLNNGGTWMGSLHRRIDKESFGWLGPTKNAQVIPYPLFELGGPEGFEYIPFPKSDIYLFEPFAALTTSSTKPNYAMELLYYKVLTDIRGTESEK